MSAKKGFVFPGSDPTLAAKIAALNVGWYYTWNATIPTGINVPFVPMVWSAKTVPSAVGLGIETPGVEPVLLCFNEPDRSDQSNMTVDSVISYWPILAQTGRRLGSPATASSALNGVWFTDFMTRVAEIGARVDFIAIHWYASPNVSGFLSMLDNLYAKYKLPIWITEFAVADWKATSASRFTVDDVATFMRAVLPELDKRPYIERYAWKTRKMSDVNMGTSALFNDDGSLTSIGNIYASHTA